jgi:trehalose 6-phosphate phosphatase
VAIAASFRSRPRSTLGDTSCLSSEPTSSEPTTLLAPFRDDPGGSAFLFDVDGTLAPITDRAEEATVPEGTRRLLAELGNRYGLVVCVSGRRAADARQTVGLGNLAYIGNHGFEQLWPGDQHARLDPALEGHEGAAPDLARRFDTPDLRSLRLRIEDKGPIVAFHWRGAPDEAAAEARAGEIAAAAERAGLVAHWGRKVLEVRPAVAIDKGVAVARLVSDHGSRRAAYCGDDTTDLDAFRGLRRLAEAGALQSAVCVAVASDEGPAELRAEADIAVSSPDELVSLLRETLT